jgi:predicted DNA-binding transcriptional regulator YafY
MPDSTDPVLVNWSNTRARPLADATEIFLAKVLAYKDDYVAQGIAAAASTAGAEKIADGYASDGRVSVTGTKLANFKAAVDQMATALNVTLVSGVGATVKAVADGIQVNGTPR